RAGPEGHRGRHAPGPQGARSRAARGGRDLGAAERHRHVQRPRRVAHAAGDHLAAGSAFACGHGQRAVHAAPRRQQVGELVVRARERVDVAADAVAELAAGGHAVVAEGVEVGPAGV
ncbi:MAG: hypothetical protein ACK559_14520, partial [bacterium]